MSKRLRSLDSKISFFAFADIITAVSGMLIFITLLLATDLGQPTDNRAPGANSELEQRLHSTLERQTEAAALNRHLQELLAAADTAPDLEKLQTDITRLRSQVSEEQKKQTSLTDQLADSQIAIVARDQTLGLTDLKARIQGIIQEAESLTRQETKARGEMATLDRLVAELQSKLLKLRQRDGQLWLIPDKSATSKEPILVTVAGTGATIDRFDHPEQRKQSDKARADSELRSYLDKMKAINQYVVFEVKPSGIELFQEMVKSARGMGFDVGYDALEETKQPVFATPPPIDEPAPETNSPPAIVPTPFVPGGNHQPPADAAPAAPAVTAPKASMTNAAATTPPAAPAPPKSKSWWQRFLEWIGIK
jgi:hypothetical protein